LNVFNATKMVMTNINYLGTLLNFFLLDDKALFVDEEAKNALKQVFKKLCLVGNYEDLLVEYCNLKYMQTPFDCAIYFKSLKYLTLE